MHQHKTTNDAWAKQFTRTKTVTDAKSHLKGEIIKQLVLMGNNQWDP
jgi:hypothetical protein